MAIKDRDDLNQVFVTGARPKEEDFHDWQDSYLHVNDSVLNISRDTNANFGGIKLDNTWNAGMVPATYQYGISRVSDNKIFYTLDPNTSVFQFGVPAVLTNWTTPPAPAYPGMLGFNQTINKAQVSLGGNWQNIATESSSIQNQNTNYQNADIRIQGRVEATRGITAGFLSANDVNVFYGVQNIIANQSKPTLLFTKGGNSIGTTMEYDGSTYSFVQKLNENRAAFPPFGAIKVTSQVMADDAVFAVNVNNIDSLRVNKQGIATVQPSASGAGTWKLGKKKNASVALATDQFIEVEIDGTIVKLAIVQ